MTPTIVRAPDGRTLAVGASGGRRITNCLTQLIAHVLDFGMGAQDAVAAPRLDASTPLGDGGSTFRRRGDRQPAIARLGRARAHVPRPHRPSPAPPSSCVTPTVAWAPAWTSSTAPPPRGFSQQGSRVSEEQGPFSVEVYARIIPALPAGVLVQIQDHQIEFQVPASNGGMEIEATGVLDLDIVGAYAKSRLTFEQEDPDFDTIRNSTLKLMEKLREYI